jgi:hypothetical protein
LTVSIIFISVVTWVSWRRLVKQDRQQEKNSDVQIAAFFGSGVISYLLVFTANWLFTNPRPDIIPRLLMPMYLGVVLGLLGSWALIQEAWFSSRNWLVRMVPVLLTIISIYWYSPQMVDVITQSQENNTVIAYRWRDSQIMNALKGLPADQVIISNKAETVLMWADRPAHDLFEHLNPSFIRETAVYGSDETDVLQKTFQQGAALVIFHDFPDQLYGMYGERGRERLMTIFDGLTVFGQYPEGTIYLYPSQ